MPSILFVFSSADKNLVGNPAGYYLPEAAHPYYIFSPSCEIDFASPKGTFPVDPASIELWAKDKECIDFLKDETVKAKFGEAKTLSDVDAAKYDVIFYPGGHAPVIDLPQNPLSIKLASDFYRAGKITAAVCHGTAALAEATDSQGKSIFVGKSFTGFSNAEEKAVNAVATIPFLLEDEITALGGKYEKAADLFGVKVVVDGNLYTGQNPNSAGPLAKEILAALNK
ncbi:class I glutamine amidotransferase-like protein [Mycena floridula]|nr:class I glutamine amidotransferase-like protein [Mycena floridula]